MYINYRVDLERDPITETTEPSIFDGWTTALQKSNILASLAIESTFGVRSLKRRWRGSAWGCYLEFSVRIENASIKSQFLEITNAD